jgi:DNA mismatch repair ATPase MutS
MSKAALLESLLDDSVLMTEELRKYKAVFYYLEGYPYGDHPKLRQLCSPFLNPGHRPSQRLRSVAWLGFAVGLRMNFIFRGILNIAFPWDFTIAKVMDIVRGKLRSELREWLNTMQELEAMLCLANYSYLNPQAVFPDISTDNMPVVLEAEALGHPLLPDKVKKRNDFRFENTGDIALVTGSNMSGKSTFLKTIGINMCLAYAGGPVDAELFRCGIMRVYSCIQIHDSVTEGFSFFYAEVKRLKRLLNELEQEELPPVLFLIDEIFKGTNNRERLTGGRSYIHALVKQNGFGIITTHDLELTQLEDEIKQLSNYHFREEVKDGKMVFDYRIHPGPCPTTNALKIMAMEGLPVRE